MKELNLLLAKLKKTVVLLLSLVVTEAIRGLANQAADPGVGVFAMRMGGTTDFGRIAWLERDLCR